MAYYPDSELSGSASSMTEIELQYLTAPINLVDGHAHRAWNEAERAITRQASETLARYDRSDLAELEADFAANYLSCAGQSYLPDFYSHQFCFTASSAIEAVANFCRLENHVVGLIEPCFDNLHDIMARHRVPLIPVEEGCVQDVSVLQRIWNERPFSVLFLVLPNNPTGFMVGEQQFVDLASFCVSHGITLVVDATFRHYLDPNSVYDQYAAVRNAELSTIFIEDTGKTWPTRELKAPFLAATPLVAPGLKRIFADFQLHVPPFSLALVGQFVRLPHDAGLGYIHKLVRANRAKLGPALESFGFTDVGTSFMSVAWVRSSELANFEARKNALETRGIRMLDGARFYWSRPAPGHYLRFALHRDASVVDAAAHAITEASRDLWGSKT